MSSRTQASSKEAAENTARTADGDSDRNGALLVPRREHLVDQLAQLRVSANKPSQDNQHVSGVVREGAQSWSGES